MIRSEFAWDENGKGTCRVRLSAREFALATAATGLPEQAFVEQFVMLQDGYTGRRSFSSAGERPEAVVAWIHKHANEMPKWWPDAVRGEQDSVEEFHLAGHDFVVDENGKRDIAWHNVRGALRFGCVCDTCGYCVDTGVTKTWEVPDCDGPEGKVRRRRKRLDYVAGLLRDAETALHDAQRQAGMEHVESEADVRAMLDDVVFSTLKSQVQEVGIAVRSKDGLHTIWCGAEIEALAESARNVADQVKKYSEP